MPLRCLALARLLALLIGCFEHKDEGESSGGGDDKDPEPTGPAYALKLYAEKAGDKMTIVENAWHSMTTNVRGADGKLSTGTKETEQFEYTETVQEIPDGGKAATKATRAYKVAKRTLDGGPARTLSYSGKTIQIVKKGNGYTFTVNGKNLPPDEAKRFKVNYETTERFLIEDMLPNKPVKVHEKWSLDAATMKRVCSEVPFPVNPGKSSAVGRLTRVYTKDGQQWGVLELKLSMVVEAKQSGASVSGSIEITLTREAPIDGSSPAAVMTMRMNGTIDTKQMGGDAQVQFDGEVEETRSAAK
jgi:hypothetical protein